MVRTSAVTYVMGFIEPVILFANLLKAVIFK